jgi:hypothetical protein
MRTVIAWVTRVGRGDQDRRDGGVGAGWRRRRGWGAVAVLAWVTVLAGVGALAAGCASASSVRVSVPGPVPTEKAAAKATPVPTVTGDAGVSCIGWPTGTASTALPLSFVPARVERCVEGYQSVAGQGVWLTATLERADSGLTGLVNALRAPSVGEQRDHACSAIATVPQVIVLIGTSGQQLAYRLPSTGCDLTASKAALALDALPWQPVSVHLISQSPDLSSPDSVGPGGTVKGLSTGG